MTLLSWFETLKTQRQSWHIVENAWKSLHPEWENRPGLSAALLQELRVLEQAGRIVFPKDKKRWSSGNPSRPEWVCYVPPERDVVKAEYKGPWHSKLGFNTQYKDRTLDLLWDINRFLLHCDVFEYHVPLKERSLQICGDEKRLDAFRQGSSTHLFKDLLAMSTIGAFHVEAPLPYESYPASLSTVALILENQDSYYSFRVWNRKSLQYRAILYGCGNAFSSSYRGLAELQEYVGITQFEYLGDIDYAGIHIPGRVAALLNPGLIHPATAWYQWLLTHGVQRELDEVESRPVDSWMDTELGSKMQSLWASGKWIPQESLGLDRLMSLL